MNASKGYGFVAKGEKNLPTLLGEHIAQLGWDLGERLSRQQKEELYQQFSDYSPLYIASAISHLRREQGVLVNKPYTKSNKSNKKPNGSDPQAMAFRRKHFQLILKLALGQACETDLLSLPDRALLYTQVLETIHSLAGDDGELKPLP